MAYESNSIFWIEVEKVVPNPFQPRREFDVAKLQELSESIRMYGILQPLVVTRREIIDEDGSFTTEYELIAGERRLRASKLAGLAQVPVLIRSGEESELMKLELAIIENLQREDLNAVDRAQAFKQLADQFGLSHTQVAQKVGRSREYVANSIRLLGLPDTILNALRAGDISDGHARTLLMLNDRPTEQDVVFREIMLKKLSVREVERISRKIATEKVRKKSWRDSDPELIAIEREFTETFGTRVEILKTGFGGKMTIDYFSPDDLRKLLEVIHKAETSVYGGTETKMLAHIATATPLERFVDDGDTGELILVHKDDREDVAPKMPVTERVPTTSVQENVSPQEPVEESAQSETQETDPESYREDSFTRHDTLEEPETSEEVLLADEIRTENDGEYDVVEQVLDRVADMQSGSEETVKTISYEQSNNSEMSIPTEIPHVPQSEYSAPIKEQAVVPEVVVEAPAPVESVKSQEDETDLYSLRNFSL